MTAGANLDPGLCVQEWPTLLSGIVAFLAAKLGLDAAGRSLGHLLPARRAYRAAALDAHDRRRHRVREVGERLAQVERRLNRRRLDLRRLVDGRHGVRDARPSEPARHPDAEEESPRDVRQ